MRETAHNHCQDFDLACAFLPCNGSVPCNSCKTRSLAYFYSRTSGIFQLINAPTSHIMPILTVSITQHWQHSPPPLSTPHWAATDTVLQQQRLPLLLTQSALQWFFGRRRISQSSVWIEDLTFFPTFTCWWWLAPLAGGLALGPRRALHHIAHVAGEAHHVIQVKAVAYGASVDGATWVPAADGYKRGWLLKRHFFLPEVQRSFSI